LLKQKNTECAIAMGIHAGDHAIYPDCRQEFRDIDFEAFKAGNWGAEKVVFYTPYLDTDKFGILKDGANMLSRFRYLILMKYINVQIHLINQYKHGVWK
jgi:7-cyano-7-deazaguanine synthase in queuosine biosynthesis